MSIWEQIFVGVLALGVLFWMLPGVRQSIERSKDAPKDWKGLLIPIVLVVGFVILLISSVA
jgi:hypothetical protein